jgi:HPt (histidine-containing phosphotransfer) domain-containing protein
LCIANPTLKTQFIMANQYEYVDLTYLEGIAEGDNGIVKELIEIFIDQMPEFKNGFEDNLRGKNWLKIAALAHKAKSSVVSMGMKELGEVDLKNLELLAKQLRIEELNRKEVTSEAQKLEIDTLESNIEGYSEERILWVKQNTNLDVLKQLIDRFNSVCNQAVKELNNVIRTY